MKIAPKGWVTIGLAGILGLGLVMTGCEKKPEPPPPGAPPPEEAPSPEGMKAELFEAAKAGDAEKIKTVLKANASLLESKDGTGRTPLHEAALNNQKAAVTVLLNAKAKVNAKDSTGATPLHLVATTENRDMAAQLIAANADVNAKDNTGATPMYVAAVNGQRPIVELLLASKGDPTIKAKDGTTPFQAARKAEKADVAVILYNQEALAAVAKKQAEGDAKIFESQKKRAAEGSSTAQYDLGMRYIRGTLVEKDEAKAREWLEKAAAGGSTAAAKVLKDLDAKAAKPDAKK